jgi:hypothetical protein
VEESLGDEMARYIDADKFAERIELSPAFKNMAFEGDLLQRVVLDLLDNAPTADVVEVVRCKDCEHWIYWADEKRCSCDLHHIYTNRNDFCSYGERRDT